MAITLDELLGRNKRSQEQEQVQQSFPSYEEFQSSRMNSVSEAPSFEQVAKIHQNDENYPKFQEYDYSQSLGQSQSLYEFTRKDNDRLSQQELYAKLSHSNNSFRPVFNKSEVEQVVEQKRGIFTHRIEQEDAQVETKKKSKINTKGKLIIAAYIAVVAVVAGLIIANSGKLNMGKAITPSSNVSDIAIVQTLDK